MALILTLFWTAVLFHLGVKTFHQRVSWRRGAA